MFAVPSSKDAADYRGQRVSSPFSPVEALVSCRGRASLMTHKDKPEHTLCILLLFLIHQVQRSSTLKQRKGINIGSIKKGSTKPPPQSQAAQKDIGRAVLNVFYGCI